MADSNSTLAGVQEELESVVECPIHYGVLVQPKSLPCGHVLCLECVRRWVEARMGILVCPECNSEQILPQNGVDGLPDPYPLVQLCDYLGNVEVGDGAGADNATKPAVECGYHKNHSLDRICRDCKQPVCQECARSEHAGHMCLDVQTFVQHMDGPLKKLEKQAREREQEAGKSCTDITKMRELLRGNRDASLATIDHFLERLIEQATSAGKQLRGQVEAMYADKDGTLESQEHTLQEMADDIEDIVRLVSEEGRASVDDVSSLPSLVDDATRRLKEFQNKTTQSAPKTSSDIWVEMDGTILEWFQPNGPKRIGGVATSEVAYPSECKLKVVSETPTLLSQGVEVELALNDGHGTPVKIQDNQVISAEVLTANGNRVEQVFEKGKDGKFVTKFGPQCIGKYSLIAKVYNVHVKNSPLNIMVQPRGVAFVELRGHTPFKAPHDVCKVGTNFMVLDDEQIQVVDSEGQMVNKFVINDQVFQPYAVAYHDQVYYVSALKGQKVVKFSRTGLPISDFGGDVFHAPTGIAVAKNGDIYVADFKKHCIYVFSSDGALQYQFSGPGNGSSELTRPWFMKLNHRGQLLVADCGNHRIQVFDPRTGKGVKSIYVEHQGKPLNTRGIDVDRNNNIYVTGRAAGKGFVFECVMVYSPEGDFIGSFADSPPGRGLHMVRGIHVVDSGNKTTAMVVDGGNAVIRLYVI